MKTRDEIVVQDRWAIETIYETQDAWRMDYEALEKDLSKVSVYRGRLAEGADIMKDLLDLSVDLDRRLEKLYVYAHLRHDEDTTVPHHKTAYEQSIMLHEKYAQLSAYIQPEMKNLSENLLRVYLAADILKDYRFYIEQCVRQRAHILSDEEENLMALLTQVFRTASNAFRSLNDADLTFPDIIRADGTKGELSHGQYHVYLTSQNRVERERAFENYHQEFADHTQTFAALLQGCVMNHHGISRARKHESCLHTALFGDNIPTEVYHNLVQTVNDHLSVNHEYFEMRKKFLRLDELHLYDVYVPLTASVEKTYSFDESVDCILEALRPLGGDYLTVLKAGVQDRWIDKYENKNKRSGAYSSGCYDSDPFVLMNFDSTMRSVFTLAHESGHSMHSHYACRHQPPQYAQYTIFVAEVASTVNEQLLGQWFLDHAATAEEKIYILSQQIEDLRATLVRQTMFAEFELFIHRSVENNQPLTADLLKERYFELNKSYFGPHVHIDQAIEIEWARIPHFYYNFYVYKYATGISAAIHIAKRLLAGDPQIQQTYLQCLSAGGSQYSIDLLNMVGVDLSTPEPIALAMRHYQDLIRQMSLLGDC